MNLKPGKPVTERTQESLNWLKKNREKACPNDGGFIGNYMLTGTFWCPACMRVWKVKLFGPDEKTELKDKWYYE